MASTIHRPAEPPAAVPTVPTAEAWRATTPTERLRVRVEINAALSAQKQAQIE